MIASHSRGAAQMRAIAARIRGNRNALLGLCALALILLFAILVPLLSSGDPNQINPVMRNRGPSWDHPFGTDAFGRDLMLRMAVGARFSLGIAMGVTIATVIVGSALGLLSGYRGGWIDTVISRIVDALMSFPSILLALAIMAALGSSLRNIVVALSLVYMPRIARVARAATISEKSLDYVDSARACGASATRIMLRHILPNITSPVIVQGTIIFAYALVAEAALGFLGIGVPPPDATWGHMLSEGRRTIMRFPYQTVYPALLFAATVLGINMLGDGMRDVFDPHTKEGSNGTG